MALKQNYKHVAENMKFVLGGILPFLSTYTVY